MYVVVLIMFMVFNSFVSYNYHDLDGSIFGEPHDQLKTPNG